MIKMIYLLVLVLMRFLDRRLDTHVFLTVLISPLIMFIVYGLSYDTVKSNSSVSTVDVRAYTSGEFIKGPTASSPSRFSCVTDKGLEEIPEEQATFKQGYENIIIEQKVKSKTAHKVLFLSFDSVHYIVESKK